MKYVGKRVRITEPLAGLSSRETLRGLTAVVIYPPPMFSGNVADEMDRDGVFWGELEPGQPTYYVVPGSDIKSRRIVLGLPGINFEVIGDRGVLMSTMTGVREPVAGAISEELKVDGSTPLPVYTERVRQAVQSWLAHIAYETK